MQMPDVRFNRRLADPRRQLGERCVLLKTLNGFLADHNSVQVHETVTIGERMIGLLGRLNLNAV